MCDGGAARMTAPPYAPVVGQPPRVSVVTIFLDAAPFLRAAIESVVGQTMPCWELMLVDDGSSDGSSLIAQEYAARDPGRIRYLTHPGRRNSGMSASRNLGVRHAVGSLIAFLDADDVWMSDKLERLLPVVEAQPDAAVVAGPTRMWHGWTGRPDDGSRDRIRSVTAPADVLYQPPELLRRYLDHTALTPATCSALIRRTAFDHLGGFDERFRGLYEDQAFFLKVYAVLPVYVTSCCTDLYRQHVGSHSALAARAGRYSDAAPTRALADLSLWLALFLARRRLADAVVWIRLARLMMNIARHLGMTWLNRVAKGALAWWHRARVVGKAQG